MIKPGTVIESTMPGPHRRPVVAVIGYASDWSAYEQEYPDQVSPSDIARSGGKISHEQALVCFPEFSASSTLRYRP